jgi:hypothetical protein
MPALSRWKFDAGSGTSLADAVGSNTGTLTNAAAWSTDFPSAILGNAKSLNFAGAYYATFPNVATLSPTASFSASLWIKNNAIPGIRDSAFGIDYGLGEFTFDVGSSYDNDGVVAVDFGVAGATYEPLKVASLAITDCVDDGGGLIKVTSNGHGLATGRTVYISGVAGTTEANSVSPWTITVVDANNFTLDGSTFANTYTSGGLILPQAPIGVWYHLAVVLRNGSADLYIDGVFQNTLTYGTTLSADPCTGPMTSGAAHFVGAPYLSFFNGLVDDIRTFDYELSGAEITDLAAGTGPGQGGSGGSPPLVSLTRSTSSIAENGGAASIIAMMDATASATVDVVVGFSGVASTGSDYTLSTTTISIASGQTSGSLTATAVNDLVYEGDETFTASIVSVTGGDASASSTASTSEVTIIDDEVAPVVNLSSSTTSIVENVATAYVIARLANASTQNVRVDFGFSGTATINTDYSASSNSLIVSAGSTSGSISVSSLQDTLDEFDETILVGITSVTNGSVGATSSLSVTITDDDATPTVSVSSSAASIAENGGTGFFQARLSAASGRTASATCNFSLSGATEGVDFTASTNTFYFPAGVTSASIGITALSDILFEGNETVVCLLSSFANSSVGAPFTASMAITNEYLAPFVSLARSTASITENSGSALIYAQLDHTHSQNVTVVLGLGGTASTASDYSVSSTSILIASGSSSGSISITALQDSVSEAPETVIVSLASVTNGTAASAASTAIVTIVDDDAPSGSGGMSGMSGMNSCFCDCGY